MSVNQLVMVFPGLLGPFATLDWQTPLSLAAPNLQLLLNRANVASIPEPNIEYTLSEIFGLTAEPDQDLPVGALAYYGDTGQCTDNWCFRIEPVHLYADGDRVLLSDGATLEITESEAHSLVAQFNGMFQEDGITLLCPHPLRWYLLVSRHSQLSTRSLWEVAGRTIDPFLPTGLDQQEWRRFLTEVQMLFHSHSVNDLRVARGRLEINGVWMWGGGGLPTSLDSNLTQVYSDDAFVKGMARLGGVPLQPFPDHFSVAFAQSSLVGRHVVVSDSLFSTVLHGDVQCWETQLLRWEQDWFGPALHALQQNQFDELELYFGSQRRYRVRRNHLRRFWRKNRPMSSFLYSSTSERDA